MVSRVNMLELKEAVIVRDKACLADVLGFKHECRDVVGTPHPSNAVNRLSLEHVKKHLRFGRRAPDDVQHTVAVCYAINLRPPTKEMRAAFRKYLEELYGADF